MGVADLGWIWIPDDTWGPAWVMHLRYERQMFLCSACDHTIERIVDANGNHLE
jgi:hypothetical protein